MDDKAYIVTVTANLVIRAESAAEAEDFVRVVMQQMARVYPFGLGYHSDKHGLIESNFEFDRISDITNKKETN
jgi:hypothetical protein